MCHGRLSALPPNAGSDFCPRFNETLLMSVFVIMRNRGDVALGFSISEMVEFKDVKANTGTSGIVVWILMVVVEASLGANGDRDLAGQGTGKDVLMK